ncbi:hypothetical protein EXIGLDRAFT_622070, partial [Exidia glandulosa HHB12029]
RTPRDAEWFPYPNKTMFFLDLLGSLPRLRLSSAQMKMILFVMQETGARDVPTYDKLRNCQQRLRELCAPHTVQHESVRGNVFFSNDIRTTIAMEFANPQVVGHFRFSPEVEAVNGVSEVWEATRWREVPPELMTPMAALGNQHFYVNELAQLIDGRFVIPTVWVTIRGDIAAICIMCNPTDDGLEVLDAPACARVTVKLNEFNTTLPELHDLGCIPRFHANSGRPANEVVLVNSLRTLAAGDPLYTIFVNLWADDVSGNVSKQYNKHINIYVANMNLPAALLQQEFFVRFFSTSPHASAAEQFSALKAQVMETIGSPYQCYHAARRSTCKFRIVVQALPGDNPQQSDNCSHMGGLATHNCRRCHNVRSTTSDNPSTAWYESNFSPGRPRSARETERYVQDQLRLACNGVAQTVKDEQTKTGIKDPIAQDWIEKLIAKARELKSAGEKSDEAIARQLRCWLEDQPGDKFHPLLDWAGLDPHTDTPVELLHTILLGIAKYVWYDLHSSWTPPMENLFAIRLQSTDTLGLNIPPLRASYMLQYKNNLIGKHFKSLLQTSAFHLHGLSTEKQFTLFNAAASLSAHLWFGVIKDMEEYLSDLQILIDNVLDAFADIDPTRILLKVKMHILTHIIDDIRRFGPAVRFSTEIFECFNAIFRMCSVLSNHQAPSRDIAIALSNIDRMKHIISGGFWQQDGEWIQASTSVQSVLFEHPIIQEHLGWVPPHTHEPAGTVVPVAAVRADPAMLMDDWMDVIRKRMPALWRDIMPILQTTKWIQGVSVVSVKGDVCPIRAWVIYSREGQTFIGRIESILVPSEPANCSVNALVRLQSYRLGKDRHPDFHMPVLKRAKEAHERLDIVASKDIQFIINVQHDCRTSDCQPTGTRVVRQEREETSRTIPVIEHADNDRFIVNMHAFHNAQLLRIALGRNLSRPIRRTENRSEWLQEKAQEARTILIDKHEQAQEKAAETRARNKAAQEAQAQETEETETVGQKRKRNGGGRGRGRGRGRGGGKRGRGQ